MQTQKTLFKNRFKKVYPGKRLLAIQLDGFSHRVIYDAGTKADAVQSAEYSGCMPEAPGPAPACALFQGIGHAGYQNNAKEIIYILPEAR